MIDNLLNKMNSLRDKYFQLSLNMRRIEYSYNELDKINLDINEVLHHLNSFLDYKLKK